MRQDEPHYKRLLLGYISNSLSHEEVRELFEFIEQEPEKYAVMMDEEDVLFHIKHQNEASLSVPLPEVDQRFHQRIQGAIEYANNTLEAPSIQPKHFLKRDWLRYAAAIIIICLGVAVYFWMTTRKTGLPPANGSDQLAADVPPGKNGAVLTLANGSKIVLDSLKNGVVTTEGKTTLLMQDGKLIYNAVNGQQQVLYNTATTPNARQFSLVLPDGSQVWLNAGSSIRYPTAFTSNQRAVTITGEVYFEVSKDKSKPFHVKVNDMDVEVLGTHFNINSYKEEADVRTTLLEGKIKVSKKGMNKLLEPGQQAIANNRQFTVVSDANMQQVMAWKNGLFNFDHRNLKAIMQEIARWYDIKVKYEGTLPTRTFRGKIERDQYLSQVLVMLGDVDIKYRIEGNTLIVTH